MENNINFWEKVAALYGIFMKRNLSSYDIISSKIRQCLNKDMKVLELACGSGQLTFCLAKQVKEWYATDFSPSMLGEAKKQSTQKNIIFSVQDATRLPYEEHSFDAVLIANALHIMPQPDLALEEIFRVLKPGGLLFAPTFIWKRGVVFGVGAWLLQMFGFKVFHRWSQEEFAQFVEKKGFLVTEYSLVGSNITPICYLAAKKAV